MIDPAGKKAARRSMDQSVRESDIDRLLDTARRPGASTAAAKVPHNEFAARLDKNRFGQTAALAEAALTDPDHPYARLRNQAPGMTIWDVPVLILYACLGVFTRIWTDVTLYFDFDGDQGFRLFAVGVSIALHLFIFAIIGNAWRGKWEFRNRNLLALAVLVGYLGFRTLTNL